MLSLGNRTLTKTEKQYRGLPADLKAKVDELLSSRTIGTDFDKRILLHDAMDRVIRALECNGVCCEGKTREERLNNL
jgi:hypothetical protein